MTKNKYTFRVAKKGEKTIYFVATYPTQPYKARSIKIVPDENLEKLLK